jgi:hypothetical protein
MKNDVDIMNLDLVMARVKTCLLLHNMNVSDRIMNGDVRAVYDPSKFLVTTDDDAPEEERSVAGRMMIDDAAEEESSSPTSTSTTTTETSSSTSTRKRNRRVLAARNHEAEMGIEQETAEGRWARLSDPVEHGRLFQALLNKYY